MRTNIPAGKLMRRAVVKRLKESATPNSGGQLDETDATNWRIVGKRWCEIVPKDSREFILGEQLKATVTHQITMRMDSTSSTYTNKFRLEYNGKTYNIAGQPLNVNLDGVLLAFPANEVAA